MSNDRSINKLIYAILFSWMIFNVAKAIYREDFRQRFRKSSLPHLEVFCYAVVEIIIVYKFY